MCKDVFTSAGRQEQLPSSTIFVVKSYINNWNESTSEFVKSSLDDESFHMTRVNKKLLVDSLLVRPLGKDQEQTNDLEQIIGVEADWVMSNDLENHIPILLKRVTFRHPLCRTPVYLYVIPKG